jgi:hypothetical protein
MRLFIPALGFSSTLVAAAMSGACSSSSATPAQRGDAQAGDDVMTIDDAQPTGDAQPVDDAHATPDSDGLTDGGGTSVWATDSTGFELTVSGGLSAVAPDASACSGSRTWTYEVASRTIARTGCFLGAAQDATVTLSPAASTQLVALVSTLTARGPSMSCGADFPDESITILGPGAAQKKYDSDFYSAPGCNGTTGTGPFVAYQDLDTVINAVDGFFGACTDRKSVV